MALNTDFKVKDSLYVGNSACFVNQTDTPKILSAGEELFDIFLQQGQGGCALTNGTGIGTLFYSGSGDTTISVDSTCNTNWNSAYDWCTSNSATVLSAATYVANNGDNVIDTIAEGSAQGQVAVTNIGNTTTQVDVNGLQASDSPQFAGACFTGAITTSSTIDGRDIAADAAQLAILQGLSGDNGLTFSSPSQGTLRVTDLDGDATDVDLGVQLLDNVQFVNVCSTGNIAVNGTVDGRDIAADAAQLAILQGLSGGNVTGASSPSQGTVRISSQAGNTTDVDTGLQSGDTPTFAGLCLGSSAGTDDTVLILNSSGEVETDEIDTRVWGSSLVGANDAGTACKIGAFCDSNTIVNSNITQDANGDIQFAGGLSATSPLSGDGSGLTGVTATAVNFPSVNKNDLDPLDKIFIQDNSDGGNKFTSYGCLLADATGLGLAVTSDTDSICIAGSTALTNCTLPMWDSGNGCFLDTVVVQSGAGDINIAGGLTVMDNLSVMGTFTCLDTSVSTTSALSVINTGTGPAFYAEQTGISQPIAKFVDTEGGQVVIGDTGNMGIGGSTDAPAEKLTVTGNIAGSGTLQIDGVATLGDTTADIPVINGCGLCFANGLPAGGGSETTVITINSSGNFETDEIDPAVWNSALVEYSDAGTVVNTVPKYSNTTGTIGSSNIVDSGTVVTIDSDTVIDAGHKLTTKASANTYTEAATFTATVDSTETTVTTLPAANLKSVEYSVTLVNGVNVTTFKVNAVHNGTGECGTTYAIVDAQAASQLDSVEISSTGSTMDLDITAATDGTTAIIKAIGIYTS